MHCAGTVALFSVSIIAKANGKLLIPFVSGMAATNGGCQLVQGLPAWTAHTGRARSISDVSVIREVGLPSKSSH